ncbi:hypothetical protein [Streptomyces litchfieldiae]|uniref:Tetracyclin repressor-like C-terminal group 31 domain-containing protein n=1 Tax=Streptomyces litchfieldiae TaxID=3075543 RepID=A0ABU2MK48_9ACTN|nr:hypothetical protein [Streptomyces sp. DSM 44938]MDT0341817.1 hypothetical protein [Streptomyces sp. DSM 44938]
MPDDDRRLGQGADERLVVADEFGDTEVRRCPVVVERLVDRLIAAAEFPDPGHPVRRVVTEHRAWFRAAVSGLLRELGHPAPESTADALVLLRDGAMVGDYLDGGLPARETLARTATALVDGAA